MKTLAKVVLLSFTVVLLAGCAAPPPQGNNTPVHAPTQTQPLTLVFETPLADPAHPAHAALAGALARYEKGRPGIEVKLAQPSPLDERHPPDLATILAGDLSQKVGEGGIEPLAARTDPQWLAQFPPESVARCMDAGALFALPWLEADNPDDSLVLISFALSLKKPEAVELMKFLATNPRLLDEIGQALGMTPALKIT